MPEGGVSLPHGQSYRILLIIPILDSEQVVGMLVFLASFSSL